MFRCCSDAIPSGTASSPLSSAFGCGTWSAAGMTNVVRPGPNTPASSSAFPPRERDTFLSLSAPASASNRGGAPAERRQSSRRTGSHSTRSGAHCLLDRRGPLQQRCATPAGAATATVAQHGPTTGVREPLLYRHGGMGEGAPLSAAKAAPKGPHFKGACSDGGQATGRGATSKLAGSGKLRRA